MGSVFIGYQKNIVLLYCSLILKIVVKSGEFFHCWQKQSSSLFLQKKDNINGQKQVVSLEYSFPCDEIYCIILKFSKE